MKPHFLFIMCSFSFIFMAGCANNQVKPYQYFNPAGSVHIEKSNGGFGLIREGKPYYIKGVGYILGLERLTNTGANSIRTWDADSSEEILDDAAQNNLSLTFGLWLAPERHGFDYSDAEKVASLMDSISNTVEKYKNHPALLIWGIGNELNIGSKSPMVWSVVEQIAQMVHRIDPNHPTMTVTSGITPGLVKILNSHAPSIDILGLNRYGGLPESMAALTNTEWNRPFIVTEWGAKGWWQSSTNSWGAPLEQLSGEKADQFENYYKSILAYSNQCLGSYAFVWGVKQERTSTWFGLILNEGEYTEEANVLIREWTGVPLSNKVPHLTGLTLDGRKAADNVTLEAGKSYSAEATVTNYSGKPLDYVWQVFYESKANTIGGDKEYAPPEVKNCMKISADNKVMITVPKKPGQYRLFVKIKDGFGNAANGNIPFLVQQKVSGK